MNHFICFLSSPLKGKGFIYLLLLNLVSNMAVLYQGGGYKQVFLVVFVSFIAAYVENAFAQLFSNRILKGIVYVVLSVLHNILIVADYYLILQFGRIFNQDIVDILSETNAVEIDNFLEAYVSPEIILIAIVSLAVFNYILYFFAKLISKINLTFITGLGALIGAGVYLYMIFSYIQYKDGMGLTQYNAAVRTSHSFMILRQTLKTIDDLKEVCSNIETSQIFKDKPSVVLVIGESASVYHSSLYGYDKNTTPLIADRVLYDSLIVFDDIVSEADATHKAMQSVFSFNKSGNNFPKTPLFPAVFQSAGYYTVMYDNQYFRGQGVTFMSDKELSDMLYDFRNKDRYVYDGDMVNDIEVNGTSSLYVIHLWGQHYTYAHRYPKEFVHFHAEDYDAQRYSPEQREIIAHYDNATLYNDFVLNEVIKKFEDQNCVVIYLSDHGEEVFELGDFMGHGGAGYRKDINYLVRVPFWIWMSPLYKDNHPDMAQYVNKAKNQPGITDDVSHLLLDLAGINTSFFSPSRSIVNPDYDLAKPRIVLNSVTYNKN